MSDDSRLWGVLDKECDKLEDKGGYYLLNVTRRLVKNLLNLPQLDSLMFVLKVLPTKSISVLDFQQVVAQAIDNADFNLEEFFIENNDGKLHFDVNIEYEAYEDRYVEVDEEAEDDLGEEVNLENVARSVQIGFTPVNIGYTNMNLENILYMIIKSINQIIVELSKDVPYNTKFILELRFKKGTSDKIKKITKKISDKTKLKAYFREYENYDKLVIKLPFEEINDNNTIDELLRHIT